MTLDQYTNLNRSDSFCYWIESKTAGLGSVWGGSAYKFGIYRYDQRPEGKMRGRLYNNKYAWYSSLGKTAGEAFRTVKNALIRIANAAKDGDLDTIESINQFGTVIKWKIAFLYSNEKFIPYYSIERLKVIAKQMGMKNVEDATLADFQRYLIKKRNGRDIHEYGVYLDNIWKENANHDIVDEIELEQDKDNNQNDNESQMRYQSYIDLLRENRNLVLTGAPGTGKTFMAQAFAKEMGAEVKFVQFHPSYDYTDFVEGLRPIDNGDGQMGFERKDGVFKEFCKKAIQNIIDSEKSIKNLTNEMSWHDKVEQFVEEAIDNEISFSTKKQKNQFVITGIKNGKLIIQSNQNDKTYQVNVGINEILSLLVNDIPLHNVQDVRKFFTRKYGTQEDSYIFTITNEVRKKRVKTNIIKADKVEKKPFVMIIDEVNRGEASKIFGELFYAIDPGYRGKTEVLVQTQYQNLVPDTDVFAKGFYVPDNVYILATMNDIDRSVESMDFAMRRRFTWKEVTPSDTQDMLDSLGAIANEAKATMARLNEVIADTDGLGDAYMVGPSYFLKLASNGGDFEKLWIMNIEPLLKEYLRGFRKANETIEKFKEAYFAEEETTDNELDLVDED